MYDTTWVHNARDKRQCVYNISGVTLRNRKRELQLNIVHFTKWISLNKMCWENEGKDQGSHIIHRSTLIEMILRLHSNDRLGITEWISG